MFSNFPLDNKDIPTSHNIELKYLSFFKYSIYDRIDRLYHYCKDGNLEDIINEKYTLEEIRCHNNNALRIAGIFGHLHIIRYFTDVIHLRLEDIHNSHIIDLTKNEKIKNILSAYFNIVQNIRSENDFIRSSLMDPPSSDIVKYKKKKRRCF